MKKFTTLEEDLIKENAQAVERFDKHLEDVQIKLEKIKDSLDLLKTEFYGDPLGKNAHWGYVGSLEHVSEYLDDIIEFLGKNE
jgi:hypothetical protein